MKNILNSLKCCLNPKVIVGALLTILLLYFIAPKLISNPILLIALICPISMLFMMRGMNHDDKNKK